jgi:hypothetical protein
MLMRKLSTHMVYEELWLKNIFVKLRIDRITLDQEVAEGSVVSSE